MTDLLSNPVFLRGLERFLIVLGSIFFAYMGYKLFSLGVDKGQGTLQTESTFFKLTFSGSGPGLFFMAFGAVIFMFALFTGGAELSETGADGSQRTSTLKGDLPISAPPPSVTAEDTMVVGRSR